MDGNGLPLVAASVKANVHDLLCALRTVDNLWIGNRLRRPKRLGADKGYDGIAFRKALRKRGIKPAIRHREYRHRKIAQRYWNDAAEIRYGRKRWCVEQRIACIDQNRRLDFLYERTRGVYDAFLTIARVRCYLKLLKKCRNIKKN